LHHVSATSADKSPYLVNYENLVGLGRVIWGCGALRKSLQMAG